MISINSQPNRYSPVNNPVIFQVNSSNVLISHFKVSVTDGSGNTIINQRLYTSPANPTGSYIDLANILYNTVNYQLISSPNIVDSTPNILQPYQLTITERLASGGAIIDGVSLTTSLSYIWNGLVDKNNFSNYSYLSYVIATATIGYTPTFGTGTTYYVASAGSSANTGTFSSAPMNFSKFKSSTFQPGDTILFNKGDTFTGTINWGFGGSLNNPITLDVYGTAASNPIIDGGGSTSAPNLQLNAGYVNVRNLVFQNNQSSSGLIYLTNNSRDVTISNCYFTNAIRGINAYNCGTGGTANLKVIGNYFSAIADNSGHTHGGGSSVQFNNCVGSGMEIAYNYCYTNISPPVAGVGDVLSVYQCSGTSSSWILVHNNNVRGGSSTPFGYCGLVLGDVGGMYQSGYSNTFINTGAEGCQVQGGTQIDMSYNTIYSAQFTYSNVGIAFGNYSGKPCSAITIGHNIINWTKSDGTIFNKWIDTAIANSNSTASGLPSGATLATPSNWSTNTADSTADPGAYDGLLPNPLWAGSPFNVGSASVAQLLTNKPSTTKYYSNSTDYLYFINDGLSLNAVLKLYVNGSGITTYTKSISSGITSGRIKLSPDTLTTMFGSNFSNYFTSNNYFTVVIQDTSGTNKSVTRTYTLKNSNCAYTPIQLVFGNQLGGFDGIRFFNPQEQIDVVRTTIKKNPFQLNNNLYTDNVSGVFNSDTDTINVASTSTYTAISDPLSDDESLWHKELVKSKQVYVLLPTGNYMPVTITNTQYKVQQNKYNNTALVRLSITFTIPDTGAKLY